MTKCFIIAEIGVNHNGSLEQAKKLIDSAVTCNVDAVKFQTFHTKLLVTSDAPKAEYQKNDKDESQSDMLQELELTDNNFKELKLYCDEKKIEFISTPFDCQSVDLLNSLNVNIFKVGSGDITNFQLLKKVALTNKPIILSTGMSTNIEVERALNYIRKYNSNITLLHCLSSYPAKTEDINLSCITTMKNKFGIPVGFSDHTQSVDIGALAVMLGASVIEKHFTLDNNLSGPDHKASMNPENMKIYVNKIREAELILGTGIKQCKESEENTKLVARRSLAVNKDLLKNHVLTEDDIISLRPSTGITADKIEDIIGKKINCDLTKDTLLRYDLLEQEHVKGMICLVGTGYMAVEYAKALTKLNRMFFVVGNTESSCEKFRKQFDKIRVLSGGLEKCELLKIVTSIIIATPINLLENHVNIAIENNIKNILVEKPAGLNLNKLKEISKLAKEKNINIVVAYNRRFYASVIKAKEMIEQDGGVKYFRFDFSELVNRIDFSKFKGDVLSKWIISMSSHVIDTAFYLAGGVPDTMTSMHNDNNNIEWHRNSMFIGNGVTTNGVPFNYCSNFIGLGRWGLEITTSKHILIFKPFETLQVINLHQINPETVILDTSNEIDIKNGILLQTKCFLENNISKDLLTLEEQCFNIENIYNKIAGY